MKGLKAFFRELFPLVITLTVCAFEFRPVTWVLDAVDGRLKSPLNMLETTKLGLDIVLLGAILKSWEWPRLLHIKGRMVNRKSSWNRTYLIAAESPVPGDIRLSIHVNQSALWLAKALRYLDGASIVVKSPGGAVTLALDAKLSADRAFMCRKDGWPGIKLTDQLYDSRDELEFEYTVQALANGTSRPIARIWADVVPDTEKGWRRLVARILILLFVSVNVDEHTLHIQPR